MTRRSFINWQLVIRFFRQLVIRFPGFLISSGWKIVIRSASVGRPLSGTLAVLRELAWVSAGRLAREGADVTGGFAVTRPAEVRDVGEFAGRGAIKLLAVSVDARARLAVFDPVFAVGSGVERITFALVVSVRQTLAEPMLAWVRLASVNLLFAAISGVSFVTFAAPAAGPGDTVAITARLIVTKIDGSFAVVSDEVSGALATIPVRRVDAFATVLTRLQLLAEVLVARLAADIHICLSFVVSLDVAEDDALEICRRSLGHEHDPQTSRGGVHLLFVVVAARVGRTRYVERTVAVAAGQLDGGALLRHPNLAVLVATRSDRSPGRILPGRHNDWSVAGALLDDGVETVELGKPLQDDLVQAGRVGCDGVQLFLQDGVADPYGEDCDVGVVRPQRGNDGLGRVVGLAVSHDNTHSRVTIALGSRSVGGGESFEGHFVESEVGVGAPRLVLDVVHRVDDRLLRGVSLQLEFSLDESAVFDDGNAVLLIARSDVERPYNVLDEVLDQFEVGVPDTARPVEHENDVGAVATGAPLFQYLGGGDKLVDSFAWPVVLHPELGLVFDGPRDAFLPRFVLQIEAGTDGRVEGLRQILPFHRRPVDVEGRLDVLDRLEESVAHGRLLGQVEHIFVNLPDTAVVTVPKRLGIISIVGFHICETPRQQLVFRQGAGGFKSTADRFYHPRPLRARLDRLVLPPGRTVSDDGSQE